MPSQESKDDSFVEVWVKPTLKFGAVGGEEPYIFIASSVQVEIYLQGNLSSLWPFPAAFDGWWLSKPANISGHWEQRLE